MQEDNGRVVRFESIPGDDERVLMIETFDLSHPRCPIVVFKTDPIFEREEDVARIERKHPVPKHLIWPT